MNVTREVILDLLPLYVADEASPATRELVEEYLKGDPALAERVRVLGAEGLVPRAVGDPPPEVELEALRRARKVLGWQRWLFGLGLAGVAIGLSTRIDIEHGHVTGVRLLLLDHPWTLGLTFACGVVCLIAYYALERRQRG